MATPDLTEFAELTARKTNKPPCQVGVALAAIAGQDLVNVTAALDPASGYTAGAVERWFKRREHKVSQGAVTNHRKQRCTCADG